MIEKGECLVDMGKFKCSIGEKVKVSTRMLFMDVKLFGLSSVHTIISAGNFSMAPVALFIFSLLTHLVVVHSTEDPPYCDGLFTVNCSDRDNPRIQLKAEGYWHEFKIIPEPSMIFINDNKLEQRLKTSSCNDQVFNDLSLPGPSPVFDELSTHNLSLIKCPTPLHKTDLKYECRNHNYTYYTSPLPSHSLPSTPQSCSMLQMPKDPHKPVFNLSALTTTFFLHFRVREECHVDKGKFKCSAGVKGNNSGLKLGLVAAVAAIVVLGAIVCCFFWKKQNQSRQIDEAFLSNYGPLQVRRYSYLEVKKMTNSFKEKLGQGGYGSVYRGKSNDGSLVAVKVLSKLKGNGEEFMNEVAAISRTSHVNIVSLLGFCFEGSKRALIYEFMPNGSLEKFIFVANTPNKNHHLGWEALDRIALGIARGLEYLHRGCNTRILHFDIKPHNILLDENFTPKVSDFGLAKICNVKESIVSMACARGTAGYIAPEVFCRNFGGVSHKSDVYSYGMMLSEMVGGRRNINAEAEDTSEIYFPHWIYKRIELDEELGLPSIVNEEDKLRARKMIIVSLWCIQTDPSNRPAMKQVIDMLEGSVDCLQIPPKPYLSSPPKSTADSSTTLVSIQ
ncbi:unnamed protein product [Prunus brigantina]